MLEPCSYCGNSDDNFFAFVTCDDYVLQRQCLQCDVIIDVKEEWADLEVVFKSLPSQNFRLGEPCRVCGNTDLNKFAIETENKLRCIQCQTTANQTLTFNKCCPVIDFISAIFTSPSAVASAAASNADLSLQHDDRQKDLQRNELIKSAWPNVSSPVATVARSQQSTKEPDGGDEIYWYSPPPTAAEPDDSVWLSPLAKIADEGDNTVNNDLLPQLRNASVVGENEASSFPINGSSMTSTPRTEITTYLQLSPADHIAQQRLLGYWHHAIVVCINSAQLITIVHYSQTEHPLGEIRLEECTSNDWLNYGVLYRIDYPDGCSSIEETLERAFSRLGERRYNPFTNNCEHFARWCKIAQPVSLQAKDAANELVASAAGKAILPVALGRLTAIGGTSGAMNASIGLTLSVGLELCKTSNELKQLQIMRARGLITSEELVRAQLRKLVTCGGTCVATSVTEAVGTTVGIKVGGFVGNLILPLSGNFVGAVLGKVIGNMIGGWLSRKVESHQN